MFKNGGRPGLMFMLRAFCGLEVSNAIDINTFVLFFKVEENKKKDYVCLSFE